MESSASPAAKNDAKGANHAPTDFSTVARRVTSRTTDLIAIGVVLVGGLSMGRQVVEWWQAEPPSVAISGAADVHPWGAGESPVELEFGDYPLALRRQIISGDRETALAALAEACRLSLETDRRTELPAGEAADRMLAHTASLTPVVESAGKWQIFRLEDRFSLVLGVRLLQGAGKEDNSETKRLACWGLAAPFDDTSWTLYLFQPPISGKTAVARTPEIPLPPEGRRLLALRGADGGSLVGFSGEGLPQDWMTFFDDKLRTQGWSAGSGWTSGKGAWSARFESDEKNRGAQVTIEFSRDASGGLMGLIQIDP
jgi:hypothetical protein